MNSQRHMILFIILSVILLTLIGIGLYLTFSSVPSEWSDDDKAKVTIGEKTFIADIAVSPQKKKGGLSSYETLDEERALLFIFSTAEKRTFWMKGMSFPIDIIWINEENIVDISENLSPPSHLLDITIAQPKEPVTHVLEINASLSERYEFSVGDNVEIEKLEKGD